MTRILPTPLRLPLMLLALQFVIFTVGRGVLLVAHWPSFHQLNFGELMFAFWHGLRFDASMIFLLWGLPILTLLIPLAWFQSKAWRVTILSLLGVGMALQAFLFLGDTAYFGYVQRHAGKEVVAMFSDTELLTEMLRADYAPHLLAFLVVAGLLGALYVKVCRQRLYRMGSGRGSWLWAVAFLLVGVVAVRGGVTNRKSVNIVHAFVGEQPMMTGYLTLNAPFAMYHSLRRATWVPTEFMAKSVAIDSVRRELGMSAVVAVDADGKPELPAFPLYRRPDQVIPQVENVVVIMLESWDAWFVDAWRESQGLEPFGLTPAFDSLASQGRLYTDFYATGQRSVHGVAAILASVPTLPGIPYIGTGGLEQNRLCFLSALANEAQAHTFFFRSAKRESYRLDRVAQVSGFDLYRGAEDLAARYRGVDRHKFGVWDEVLFADAAAHMSSRDEPFFGFLFPSSTHQPFAVPDETWRTDAGEGEARVLSNYKDSLRYADHTLGEFFASIQNEEWFDRTLFVITADHVSGVRGGDLPMPDRFRLPCLLLGPGVEPGLDPRTSSQLDILPTVVELAGWGTPYSSLGRSMVDENEATNHGAMMATEFEIIRKEGPSWLVHNLERRLRANGGDELDQVEHRLLANFQLLHQLLAENRIFPAQQF